MLSMPLFCLFEYILHYLLVNMESHYYVAFLSELDKKTGEIQSVEATRFKLQQLVDSLWDQWGNLSVTADGKKEYLFEKRGQNFFPTSDPKNNKMSVYYRAIGRIFAFCLYNRLQIAGRCMPHLFREVIFRDMLISTNCPSFGREVVEMEDFFPYPLEMIRRHRKLVRDSEDDFLREELDRICDIDDNAEVFCQFIRQGYGMDQSMPIASLRQGLTLCGMYTYT